MTTGGPYLVLEYIGTVAFAVSGGAAAVRALGPSWAETGEESAGGQEDVRENTPARVGADAGGRISGNG